MADAGIAEGACKKVKRNDANDASQAAIQGTLQIAAIYKAGDFAVFGSSSYCVRAVIDLDCMQSKRILVLNAASGMRMMILHDNHIIINHIIKCRLRCCLAKLYYVLINDRGTSSHRQTRY